jgi:hypothetical protein
MRRNLGVVVLEAKHSRIRARGISHAIDAEARDALQPPDGHGAIIRHAPAMCKPRDEVAWS